MMAVWCRHMVHQWLSAGAQHWTGGPHLWHLPACLGCLAAIHPAPCLQRELTACPLSYTPFCFTCYSELTTTSFFLRTPVLILLSPLARNKLRVVRLRQQTHPALHSSCISAWFVLPCLFNLVLYNRHHVNAVLSDCPSALLGIATCAQNCTQNCT